MRRIVKDFIILSCVEKFYWEYLYITIKTAVEKYAVRPLIFQKTKREPVQQVQVLFSGAGDRGRTGTISLPLDFESSTSANSITPANITELL